MILIRIFLKAVVVFFRLLPLSLSALLGRLLGWFLQHVIHFRESVIRLQTEYVFDREGIATSEREEMIKKIYRHFGLLIIELLSLPGISKKRLDDLVSIQGLEHFDAALARKKGVLAFAGHTGNWELAGNCFVRHGYAVAAIGKEIKGPTGELFKNMMRDDNGVESIPRRNSVKQIFRALKNNRIVVVMIDQNMTTADGEFVDFFGHPACTMTSLAVLAARSGAAVIPLMSYRDEDLQHHHAEVWPEIELEEPYESPEENHLHNTRRFNEVLEKIILRAPDQWLWMHKRWRTRPDEGADSWHFNYSRRKKRK